MKRENIVRDTAIGRIIISAHSGGYRPAAYVLDRGGLNDHVEDVFLFDAFYANQDKFKVWLEGGRGTLFGAYTDHLKAEHVDFERVVKPVVGDRLQFTPTAVEHEDVVQEFLPRWLARLGPEWQQHP